MEFDPTSAKKNPNLFGIFSENPRIKSENPIMISVQPKSILSPSPSNNTTFLCQNNSHHFQQHPMNNHHPNFFMAMIPTPSLDNFFKATHINGSMRDSANAFYPMAFTPNNNKIIHDYPNNGKSFWDFSQKNLLQYGVVPQPRVSPSLSKLMVYDAHAVVPMKLEPQEVELSHIVREGNNSRDTDLRPLVGNKKQHKINGQWTADEDRALVHLVNRFGIKKWSQISKFLNGRIGKQCRERWHSHLQANIKKKHQKVQRNNNETRHRNTNNIKGQWTANEDRALVQLVNRFRIKKWSQISKILNGRIGKQCRERWHNHLQPNIKKESWSEVEDKILIETHKVVGNKWKEIAKRLPGRTKNTIKNRWNATKRKQNAKRKEKRHTHGSNGTLLLNYIREVTTAERAENEPKQIMSMMNIGSEQDHKNNNFVQVRVCYESSQGDFNSESQDTQEDEVGGHVPLPMRLNDVDMARGSGTMDCEARMEMLSEVPVNKEMDLV